MKVCLLSHSNGREGAYAAAYRLYQGLHKIHPQTSMIVGIHEREDPNILSPSSYFGKAWVKIAPLIDELPKKLYSQRLTTPYSLQWIPDNLPKIVQKIQPDIINLHWINGGFMQIETLKKFSCPLVWTFHDMWPFTGGCHYSNNCDKYIQSCGHCPQLHSQLSWDLSRWTWQRKHQAWSSLNLTVVTPSHWLADCVKQSSLFKNFPIKVIPNGIDCTLYRPIEQPLARQLLRLPLDKKLLLFGSINPHQDRRKGLHLLQEVLSTLQTREISQDTELVIFGGMSQPPSFPTSFKVHSLGKLKDDLSLILAYNAADVFVVPSLEDNLPNTVMEALACGLPCVAFKIGGIPDMIDHTVNGYLAQPFDISDVVEGILGVLNCQEKTQGMREKARQKVETTFTIERQADSYLSLFETLVKHN